MVEEENLNKAFCTMLDAFIKLEKAVLVEEAFPKEQWERIIAGLSDLETALTVKEKLKCESF